MAVRWQSAVMVGLLLSLCAIAYVVLPEGDGKDLERVLGFFMLEGEPLSVAIFNGLGVLPLCIGAVMFRDRVRRWWQHPAIYVLGSFVAGAFILLPGLALRSWGQPADAPLGVMRRNLTGRAFGFALLAAACFLVGWGSLGSFEGWLAEARVSGLVAVMTPDFFSLCVAWLVLLADDARRHPGPSWRVVLGALPLVGPPLWVLTR